MTKLQISADLSYRLPAPCTILVQVEAAATSDQTLTDAHIDIGPTSSKSVIPAHAKPCPICSTRSIVRSMLLIRW